MSHIFISYSHKDTDYAHVLADNLQSMGFKVWIDARLDYGSQWPLEIQTQLDSCDAFIVVMTPRAFASEWVQSELQRAKRKLKPIFPLLLEGDEPWLSVESTQFYDVRGEKLPDARFYATLRRVMPVSQNDSTLHYVEKKDKVKPTSSSTPAKPKMSTEILVALIGAVVTIFTACATIVGGPLIEKWLNSSSAPLPLSATSTVMMSATEKPFVPLDANGISTVAPAVGVDASDVQMAVIPAGPFTMGSNNGDHDEVPVHTVDLDAFYMDVYEVTNARYFACVSAGSCQPPADGNNVISYDETQANYPVALVTWDMAKTYCEWRGARLPTEAEWEKAARGTDERVYPWGGDTANCKLANYGDCINATVPVGSYSGGISPYGLYDMAGNVFEWVADYYSDTYYGSSPSKNPQGPEEGSLRVIRGGSYGYDASYMRTTLRYGESPSLKEYSLGFRCAKDATP